LSDSDIEPSAMAQSSELSQEPSAKPPDPPDPPPPGAESPELTDDERAELERLRAEVTGHPPRHRFSWRTPVAVLLIVIGCVLGPVSVLGVWTANQVSDTSRYIANIEPLVHNPAIQDALTDKLTTEITSHLNVTGLTDSAASLLTSKGLPRLGTLLKTFAPSIASAVTGFVHSFVHKVVTGPRFAHAWVQVNTVSHRILVQALSGQSSTVKVVNDKVTIDLAPFIEIVKKDLASRGFTLINKLPPINPTLTLFSAKDLVKAQTAYRVINDLKIVLPILMILLLGLGVYVARNHRRALIGAGLGFAGSMVVLAAGLLIARSIYLNTVPASVLPSNAAAAMFDTLVRFIKDALRVLLVVGLVVAAAAFLTGPSVTAVRTRHAFASGFDRIRASGERRGVSTGPVGLWTYAHRKGLRVAAVGLIALLFVFWGRPTVVVVVVLVIILLLLLGLIELIGRPPARPEIADQP
jgi:hypothetical protein